MVKYIKELYDSLNEKEPSIKKEILLLFKEVFVQIVEIKKLDS